MKLKDVRVTNPSLESLPGLIVQPAKMVGAFAVGSAVGSLATSPITDAIDRRLDTGAKRGAAKLAAATGVLTLVAFMSEKSKTKPKNENAALLAAASVGAVSRLVITGLDDVMGRSPVDNFIEAEILDDELEGEGEAMSGTLLSGDYFARTNEMSGSTAVFGNNSFGSYL